MKGEGRMKKFYVLFAIAMLTVLASCNQQKSDTSTVVPLDQMGANKEITISLNQQTPGTITETNVVSVDEVVSQEMPAATSTTMPTNEQIQQALKSAGFYEGSIDGSIGKKSKAAIIAFQEQNGLTADGKVGKKTWAKLAPYLNAPGTSTTSAGQ